MTTEAQRKQEYERDTWEHIHHVQDYLERALTNLDVRMRNHDRTKLVDPEAEGFMAMAEELKLAETNYGSDEYRAIIKKYKDSTVGPHYAANDHHPEHYPDGIWGMSLLSILEMLCDWKAATLRMKDGGDLASSIALNRERFGYTDQMAQILINTAREMGMIEGEGIDNDHSPDSPGVRNG